MQGTEATVEKSKEKCFCHQQTLPVKGFIVEIINLYYIIIIIYYYIWLSKIGMILLMNSNNAWNYDK